MFVCDCPGSAACALILCVRKRLHASRSSAGHPAGLPNSFGSAFGQEPAWARACARAFARFCGPAGGCRPAVNPAGGDSGPTVNARTRKAAQVSFSGCRPAENPARQCQSSVSPTRPAVNPAAGRPAPGAPVSVCVRVRPSPWACRGEWVWVSRCACAGYVVCVSGWVVPVCVCLGVSCPCVCWWAWVGRCARGRAARRGAQAGGGLCASTAQCVCVFCV